MSAAAAALPFGAPEPASHFTLGPAPPGRVITPACNKKSPA